jgi:predicted phage terminase large subunit-like protein
MDQYGMLHIRNVIRARMDALEILETMFHLYDAYRPDLFIMEKGVIEKALGPILNQMMMTSGKYLPLHTEATTKDKRTRARSIQARMRAGGVRFNKKAHWYPDLEAEMLRFDRDIHDDQVDAMAWLGLVLDKMKEALTPREQEQEEFDEEMATTMGDALNMGRSNITGY